MYKVYADDTLIYDSTIEDYRIGKGSISLEINKSGSFTFSIYPDHFYYDNFVKLKTIIIVYKDNKIIFRGRIINDVTDYWNVKTITCEGELGFLQDSIIRPYQSMSATPKNMFISFVSKHNMQVEKSKRFKIGNVIVPDPDEFIHRSNGDYESTLSALHDKLSGSALGGYFFITHGDDGTDPEPTIHYLTDSDKVASQFIEFGSNLQDYIKTVTAENIATAIIPLGAEIDDGNDLTIDTRLTIASVNDGVDYVYSESGVEKYGWIFKTIEWDDVTIASNLKSKAEEYLENIANQNVTIELKAIDLHLLDHSIESFNLGDYIRVISKPHNFDMALLCNKLTIDLLNPANDTLVLGHTYSTFSEFTNTLVNMQTITAIKKSINSVNTQVGDISIKVVESTDTVLKADEYRVYGKVDKLNITLVPTNDTLLHEYCFEFIPNTNFKGLTISPSPSWVTPPNCPEGKTCQVSIVRGVAIMVYA